jgi:hypothetical protein
MPGNNGGGKHTPTEPKKKKKKKKKKKNAGEASRISAILKQGGAPQHGAKTFIHLGV